MLSFNIYEFNDIEVSLTIATAKSYTPFTWNKNCLYCDLDCNMDSDLDRNPEVVPVNLGHSLFNTTKRIILLFIVQSLLLRKPPYVWIKIL